jgi:hypothetical protein
MFFLIWRGAGPIFLLVWGVAWILTTVFLEWSGLARHSDHVLTGEAVRTIYLLALSLAGLAFQSETMEDAFRATGVRADVEFPGDLFFIPVRMINWAMLGLGVASFLYILFFDYFWLKNQLDAIYRR